VGSFVVSFAISDCGVLVVSRYFAHEAPQERAIAGQS